MSKCPHCGPTPVNHTLEKTAVTVDWLVNNGLTPLDRLWCFFNPLILKLRPERLILPLYQTLSAIGLGRLQTAPEDDDTDRTKVIWAAAASRGIQMFEYRPLKHPSTNFVARVKNDARAENLVFAFDGLPKPHGRPLSQSASWMDDKAVMRKKFSATGFPIASGGECRRPDEAVKIFNDIKNSSPENAGSVIAKPSLGSRSRHTTIHINDEKTLREAFAIAQMLSPFVIIEEELSGCVHRATVIGGKLFAVLRREPPHVIGDDLQTLRELATAENARPERHQGVFHKIEFGEETEQELARQNLSWNDVPSAGRMVELGQKIGRSSGGSNTDLTDIVHPDNLELFEKIAAFLDYPFVGIDFIIEDASRSWRAQKKCGVIECNSLPFIDLHHFPMVGQPRDAAGAVWNFVFGDSSKGDTSK